MNINNWPPVKGKIISVKKPNINKLFIGRVYEQLPKNNASVILLMNDNDYVDDELTKINYREFINNNKGIMLVHSHYKWNYMQNPSSNITDSDYSSHVNNIAKGYIKFNNKLSKGGNNINTKNNYNNQNKFQNNNQNNNIINKYNSSNKFQKMDTNGYNNIHCLIYCV